MDDKECCSRPLRARRRMARAAACARPAVSRSRSGARPMRRAARAYATSGPKASAAARSRARGRRSLSRRRRAVHESRGVLRGRELPRRRRRAPALPAGRRRVRRGRLSVRRRGAVLRRAAASPTAAGGYACRDACAPTRRGLLDARGLLRRIVRRSRRARRSASPPAPTPADPRVRQRRRSLCREPRAACCAGTVCAQVAGGATPARRVDRLAVRRELTVSSPVGHRWRTWIPVDRR